MLESGEAKSIKKIAPRDGVNDNYVSRNISPTALPLILSPPFCAGHFGA